MRHAPYVRTPERAARPTTAPTRTRTRVLLGAVIASALAIAPITAAAAAPSDGTTTLVPLGSTGWSYYRGASAPASDWRDGDNAWRTGTAPLGFGIGTGTLATRIPNDFTTKPLATYFTRSFDLAAVPADGVTLKTWADDGVIVYVNGGEALRRNLPASGAIGFGSYATAAPQSTTARATPVTVTIPASKLHVGENVIAAQVQANWRNSPNITFDAELQAPSAQLTPGPSPAPTPNPTPEPPATDSGEVSGWGAPAWRDEFDYTDPSTGKPGIDPAKWNVRDRSDLGLLQDAAVPDRNQVSVDADGIAHLKGDWLDTPIARPAGQSGAPLLTHKTGYMDQRALNSDDVAYSQRYGRWEIRAKTPTGPDTYGSLAAFWLRNDQSGEIDIMEAWGYNDGPAPGGQKIDTATTTVHTKTSGSGNEKYYWTHDFSGSTPPWAEFHTYAFEYTPSYAAVIVDGVVKARVTPADHPNLWDPSYFGSPMHVRLNLHIGPSATYWGLPDPQHRDWTKPLDYQVDYVRMWSYQG